MGGTAEDVFRPIWGRMASFLIYSDFVIKKLLPPRRLGTSLKREANRFSAFGC